MSKCIHGAVTYRPEDLFVYEELTIEDPRDNEVLVKIIGVGICHTDLIAKSGAVPYPFPAVLGHEGAGIVEKVGSAVKSLGPGDRVCMTFRSCGQCDRCDDDHPAYCRDLPQLNFTGNRVDGSSSLSNELGAVASNMFGQSSFASYAIGYETNVVKIEEGIPLEIAGPLGCGIQTGVGSVTRSLSASKGSSIVIFGGGTVGLSAVMGAKIQECSSVMVVEPTASRRDLAIELGATHVFDPMQSDDVIELVRRIVPNGADYALDATGIPSVQASALACLGSKGVLGLVGVSPPATPLPGEISHMINLGLTIKGVMEGDSDPKVFIPELVEHYKAGRLPFDKLITTYKLSEINEAVADQHSGVCVKAVLLPDT